MATKRTSIILVAVPIVLIVGLLAYWLVMMTQAKAIYEDARTSLEHETGPPFLVRPFDDAMQKRLGVIESSWHRESEDPSYIHSDVMRLAGIDPTIDGLIQLYNYRMPEFSWLSLDKNRDSLTKGALLATLFPITVDSTIHVSSDRRVAIICHLDKVVSIFRKDKNGLHEALWVYPLASIEQDESADAGK